MVDKSRVFVSMVVAGLALAACDQEPEVPREQVIAEAQSALPASENLAEKFERACAACHTDPENAAPLSRDARAWAERLDARGFDGMVESTLNGFGGMPPLGACPDCSIDDFENLIRFMSRQNAD